MNNSHTVEAHIKAFAKRENCIIGICDTAPLTLDTTRFTPFVSSNLAKRTDPAASLPGVKSIIVVGVESKIEAFPPMPEGAGILSVLGVAEDYHVVVKSLLKKLVDELRAQVNFMYKILVDSPTLDERALAVRAGLGFIGRNGLVISPEYGSRFNIGVLLTDIAIASEAKQSTILGLLPPRYARGRLCNAPCNDGGGGCSANQRSQAVTCPPNCRNCITACPTGALTRSNGLDAARCISYLTQKSKPNKGRTCICSLPLIWLRYLSKCLPP